MPLRVRPALPADFTPCAALTNHYIQQTAVHFGTEPVSGEELRAGWAKHQGRYPWLVAEVEGRFAGYAKAGPWRERAAYAWTPEVGIYVERAFHKQGVGRGLYSALFDDLRARGFHSCIGGITLPNPASVRLHEALGFRHVGTVRRAGWKMNAWHDVAFYQLDLQAEGGPPRPLAPEA